MDRKHWQFYREITHHMSRRYHGRGTDLRQIARGQDLLQLRKVVLKLNDGQNKHCEKIITHSVNDTVFSYKRTISI